MLMDISAIILSAIAGAGYGVLFYVKARQNSGEKFDSVKLGATVLLAALIGIAMVAAGMPVTQATVDVQIAAYVGYIVVLETLLKVIWRKLDPPERARAEVPA